MASVFCIVFVDLFNVDGNEMPGQDMSMACSNEIY